MSIFTGEEIFQIAMELEETSQVLYEALAAGCGNRRVADLCRRLAKQEVEHYNLFKRMREALLSRPASREMTREDLDFAQSLVNDRVVPDPADARRVAEAGSLGATLDLAIRMEKDSVLFYTEILPGVAPADAGAVGRIIAEEKRHVQDLTSARRAVH